MDVNVIERQFARIGARARFVQPRQFASARTSVSLDISRDRLGEFFEIRVPYDDSFEVQVLQAEPRLRHLLLMSRNESDEKRKFLCGHDERHWFVAAIPENRSVSSVRTAMEALKPAVVISREFYAKVRQKNWNRRRNAAFLRQGEWFFLPEPTLVVDTKLVLTNEPLQRGGGKPHLVEFLYRTGGETVYFSEQRPNGLTQRDFNKLVSRQPEVRSWRWRVRRRNPFVHVKGRIRRPDHATITLHEWHLVMMNTETEAAAMQHVVFLD